jgi:hypothetical protein
MSKRSPFRYFTASPEIIRRNLERDLFLPDPAPDCFQIKASGKIGLRRVDFPKVSI